MPDPVTGVLAATGVGSALVGSSSAKKAANAQVQAADMGAAEMRAAREELRKLLEPYTAAGGPALQAQLDLLGLGDAGSQAEAIAAQEQNPLFQAIAAQGEDAILQNASATGGLRGGNVQGALAQFRPALLNQFIADQYNRLGGITQLGQNSAAGVGAAGINTAGGIADLFGDAGAARAGGALAQGQAWGGALNLGGLLGASAIQNAQRTPGGLF